MSEFKGESLTEEEYKKKINSATGLPFGEASEIEAEKASKEMSTREVPVPGTPKPEDTRTTGQQFKDWAGTPAGTATLGLGAAGLAALGGIGLKRRRDRIASQNAQGAVEFPELSAFDEHVQNMKAQQEQLKAEGLAQQNAQSAERHRAWQAGEARKAEQHLQKSQGNSASPTSATEQDIQFLKSSDRATLANSAAEAEKTVTRGAPAPNEGPVAVPPRQAPYGNVTMNQPSGIPDPTVNPLQAAGVTPLNAPTAGAPAQVLTPPVETQITPATPANSPPANTTPTDEVGGPPAGYRTQYNKNKTNPLGPSAFNYLSSQVEQKGVETPEIARKIWEEQYGKKNVSYEEFMKDYSLSKRPPKPVVEGAPLGGSGGTPKFVPDYIKGNASIKGMGSLAAFAAALGLAGSEKGQEAMAKASNAIKDIGFSPDILTNKAEEMGRLGTGYVTAGNPSYRRELEQKLQSTKDPEFRRLLEQELFKISPQSNSPYSSVPPPR
jgi:hypothetical protein